MKDFPYRSQEHKDRADVVIPVKLFDNAGTIRWWLAEYDPEAKIAFGYVTGFFEDEWGDVSLEELEELEVFIKVEDAEALWGIGTISRFEVDEHFTPTKFPDLPFHKKSSH